MGDEGISGHIAKGPVHRKVDARVNSMSVGERQALKYALADPARSYLDTLAAFNVGLTPIEEKYLREHWYLQPGPPAWEGWWPALQPIEPIIRQGLIKAIDVSLTQKDPLPIDSYWVIAGPEAQVEVFISRTLYQVTRIIYTPPPDPPTGRQRPVDVDLWIVRSEVGPVPQGQVRPEETAESIVEVGDRTIVTWKRREF